MKMKHIQYTFSSFTDICISLLAFHSIPSLNFCDNWQINESVKSVENSSEFEHQMSVLCVT